MNLIQSLKKLFKKTSDSKNPEPPSHEHDDGGGDDFGNCCRSESEEAEHRAWKERVQERLRVINEREKESKT